MIAVSEEIEIFKKNKGFSLIEVILSVALITVGVLTSMQLLSGELLTSIDSRDQLIAGGLAQEGVELVRNIRDNNWASDALGSFTHITNGNNCRIDKNYAYPANIVCGQSMLLYIDANEFYTHTDMGTTPTKFSRKLIISDDGGDKKIDSITTWGGDLITDITVADCKLKNKCVYAEIILSKWAE